MAKGTYFQRGESLDYLNSGSADIGFGDVIVIGDHIGIAGNDIAVGAVGSVHVEGVFALPKASGAIAVGANIKWDGTDGAAAAASSGDTVAGYAVAAAAAADTTVLVKLNG